jgi:hypothetical protein
MKSSKVLEVKGAKDEEEAPVGVGSNSRGNH